MFQSRISLRVFIFISLIIFNAILFSQDGEIGIPELNANKITVESSIKLKTKELSDVKKQVKLAENAIKKEKVPEEIEKLTSEKDALLVTQETVTSEIADLNNQLIELKAKIKQAGTKKPKKTKEEPVADIKEEIDEIKDEPVVTDGVETIKEREARINNELKAKFDQKVNAQKEQQILIKQQKLVEKNALIEEIKKVKNEIKLKIVELKNIDKELSLVIATIITSNDKEIIKENSEKKSSLILQQTIAEKDKTDLQTKLATFEATLKIKDDGFEPAEGTLNWSKIYDIETIQKKKPGTWNISVLAKDSMDNYSEENSINIKVDPKSDIPFLNVINPQPNSRVPGNLMVVGTAFDDDKVKNVVMYLNNENIERNCIGTDFWYNNLDTTEMDDGVHTLSFRVYDVNDVQSKLYEVPFILDRKVPLITVDTINSGAVVSGRKKIGGTVSDTNGIKSIEYSLDNRYSFTKISSVSSTAPGKISAGWNFSLNTNLLPGGTQVVWIKAVDNAGSEGYFPLTLIVDREVPVIGFNFPQNKEKIGDRFTIYGYAYDNVDIKSVDVKIKFSGFPDKNFPVTIVPGNPFWKFPVDVAMIGDVSKLKSGSCVIMATVKDVADNIVTNQLNLILDTEVEKPVMTLKSIKKGDSFANTIPLYGTVTDDEEMKDVTVNLYNTANEVVMSKVIDSKYSFSTNFDVSSINEGEYTVETIPRDFFVIGNSVKEKIWIDRSSSRFDIEAINSTWAGKIFNNKMSLDFSVIKYGEMPDVTYEFLEKDGKTIIESGVVKLKTGTAPGVFTAVPIIFDFTKDKKYEGLKLIKLTAIDKAMKKSTIVVPIIIDTTAPAITDIIIDEKTGLMEDIDIVISDNQIINSIQIIQTAGKSAPVTNEVIPGEPLESIINVKGEDGKFLSYDYEIKVTDTAGLITNKKFKIRFKDTDKTEIKLKFSAEKKDNTIYTDAPVVFIPDSVINPDEIRYAYGQSPVGVETVKVKLSALEIPVIQVNQSSGFYMFDISPEIRKDFNIGENSLSLSYAQESNEVNFATLKYFNDLAIPKSAILWPPSYIPFNNDLTIYGMADDDSGLTSVFVGLDSTNDAQMSELKFEPISSIRNFKVPVINPLRRGETQTLADFSTETGSEIYKTGMMYKFDLKASSLPEGERNIRFKITDKAGKIVYRNMVVIVDRTNPGVRIVSPTVGESVNGVITVRGDASDDTGIGSVILKMNDRIILSDTTNIWDALYDVYERKEFNPANKEKQDLNIDVIGIDFAGNRTTVTQSIIIDKQKDIPQIYINSPAVEGQRYTIDNVKFEGVALDDDGIDSVQYRLDLGLDELDGSLGGTSEGGWRNIILKESEKPNWSITMAPGYLKPGKHTLEVRCFDYGFLESSIASITFQIDKENPVIHITSPENGSYIKGLRVVNGKASDPNQIASIEVSTNNGWSFVPAEGFENWQYFLDSSTLPDGPLNFLIKAKDIAGSESYSFSVYNMDNTPPELTILQPKDGFSLNGKYKIIGRAKDNIALDKGYIKITQGQRNVLEKTDEYGFVQINGSDAWDFDIDTSKWANGEIHHMVVRMYDLAGNLTERSLDFFVDQRSDFPVITLDQPQSGQYLGGEMIEFYGTADDDDDVEAVWIDIDGLGRVKAEGTTEWKYLYPSVNLEPGMHRVVVVAQEKPLEDGSPGKFSQSISRSFFVQDSGVVINIKSHDNGYPVTHRPWIIGSAYYHERDLELKIKKELQTKKYYELLRKYKDDIEKVPAIEDIPMKKAEVLAAVNKHLAENRVTAVYMSYDNGNTYKKQLGSVIDFRHRLQTQLLGDGIHMLQFKGVTASGKETIKYFKIKIDRQKPVVIIDSPVENKSVNEKIIVKGSVDDNNEIVEMKVRLKQFDKNLGKLPKFIEGMYLWAQIFSGPIASGGFGFSFFDNIVRLEGLFGWIPTQQNLIDMGIKIDDPNLFSKDLGWTNAKYEPRFAGFAAGGKLLARVIDLPFEFFLGEDAKNFSVSVEIGAGFFWISGFAGASSEVDGSFYRAKRETERLLTGISSEQDGYDPVKDAKVLAGFMYQVDFFKVEKYGILKNFAMYFEHSFYFIASEVESTLTQQIGFGMRNSLF